MKKVLIILAVLLLAFTCEKEGEIELSNANLAGIWNVTKITMDGETTELPPGMIMVELKNLNSTYNNSLHRQHPPDWRSLTPAASGCLLFCGGF